MKPYWEIKEILSKQVTFECEKEIESKNGDPLEGKSLRI